MFELLFGVGALVAFYVLFKSYRFSGESLKRYFLPAVVLRIIAGLSLGWVYTYYYHVGDTFVFFEDAKRLLAFGTDDPFRYFNFILFGDGSDASEIGLANHQVRSVLFVKTLSIVLFFSLGNYWIAAVYFAVLAFVTSWYATNIVDRYYHDGINAAVISFLFVPSVLFWSSGIIKETVALGSIFIIVGVLGKHLAGGRLRIFEWVLLGLSVYSLLSFKYYWAGILVPCVVATWAASSWTRSGRSLGTQYPLLIWWGVFTILILIASTLHPNFYLSRILDVIVENNQAYNRTSGPGVVFYNLSPDWKSIALNSPLALVSGLFRPSVFDVQTIPQLGIALENLLLIGLVVINIKHLRGHWHSSNRLIVTGWLCYVTLLAIFLALSTPNFGTLSRYRVGFLPFFFFILLYHPASRFFGNRLKLK